MRGGNLDTDKRILEKQSGLAFKYEGWVSNDNYRLIHIFRVKGGGDINFCFSPDNPTLFFEVSKKKNNGDIVIKKAYDIEKGVYYEFDSIFPVCFEKNFVTDNKKIWDEALKVSLIQGINYSTLCLLRACSMDLEQYDGNFWKSYSNNYNPQMPPNYGMPMKGNNQGFNNMPVNSNMGNNNGIMNNMNGNVQAPYDQINNQQNQGPYQPQLFYNGNNNNFNNNNFNNNNNY